MNGISFLNFNELGNSDLEGLLNSRRSFAPNERQDTASCAESTALTPLQPSKSHLEHLIGTTSWPRFFHCNSEHCILLQLLPNARLVNLSNAAAKENKADHNYQSHKEGQRNVTEKAPGRLRSPAQARLIGRVSFAMDSR
jgi:hypothetical protein